MKLSTIEPILPCIKAELFIRKGASIPRLRSQTETRYVQTGPDGKCLCPDRPRLKVPMSRPSQTESGYVQTFVRSKFFVRFSCVRRQICPDHPRPKQYMSRLSCVLVQTIVRSNSNSCVQRQIFRAFMSRPSCVHVQTIVRSPDHRAFMSRPSCVHVQTIVRSSVFPDRVILNARHPLRAFISVWTYLVSVWDLSLGWLKCFFREDLFEFCC